MSETNDTIITKEKKPRGRPKKPEGEAYASKLPKDKEYFKKYYHKSNVSDVIQCELCTRTITRRQLTSHQKSTRCIPIYKLRKKMLKN